MAFSYGFNKIRKLGRKVVLPIDDIKKQMIMSVPTVSGSILDLGAGTMFWSEWLYKQYNTKVFSVDTFYEEKGRQYNDYFKCIEVNEIKMLWMCDVIHHLEESFLQKLINSIIDKEFSVIVIKDIDCRHRFGNFMNKVHDFVINREKAHNVNPCFFEEWLKSNGYEVIYRYIPKLWYPHFILIGVKKE